MLAVGCWNADCSADAFFVPFSPVGREQRLSALIQRKRFIKINEARHTFARIAYLRTDGLLGEYIPDFLVATKDGVFLVETKATGQVEDGNVQQKRTAAVEWCKGVNALPEEDRLSRVWAYLLISETAFYNCRNGNGTFADLCARTQETASRLRGEFDFG